MVDCASLSLELSADTLDDDVSCCSDNGRVFASNLVAPQPKRFEEKKNSVHFSYLSHFYVSIQRYKIYK